jgi:hypothetical protein
MRYQTIASAVMVIKALKRLWTPNKKLDEDWCNF